MTLTGCECFSFKKRLRGGLEFLYPFCASLPVLLVLTGCPGTTPEAGVDRAKNAGAASADAATFRVPPSEAGRLVVDDGELRFSPCGESGTGILIEDTANGEATHLFHGPGGGSGGIPAVVRLEDNRLLEIRYAGPEGMDCSRMLSPNQLEARGNEPFWLLRVRDGTAEFVTPQAPEGLDYHNGAWHRPGEHRWQYRSERVNADGAASLTLELIEDRCTDSMSGARFPFRAVVHRDGERLEGCALEGRDAQPR